MKIAIIGAGSIGKAIKSIIAQEHTVLMWDKKSRVVKKQADFGKIINTANVIFLCIPSSSFREVAEMVKLYKNKGAFVVSLTKGLEFDTGEMVHDILNSVFLKHEHALLSGPMLAEEIIEGGGSAAIVASKNIAIYKKLYVVFKKNSIKLEYSKEIYSVAISGILKNVYALMIGIVEGLDFGDNIKGYFGAEIILEFKSAAKHFKIKSEVLMGIAGLGDFIATALGKFSLNQEAGRKIALGQTPPQSEGLVSLPHILKMLKGSKDLKIMQMLKEIIILKKDPRSIVTNYLYKR